MYPCLQKKYFKMVNNVLNVYLENIKQENSTYEVCIFCLTNRINS